MADYLEKRKNIATHMVDACTRLWDALRDLEELTAERAQAGSFSDADFEGTDLTHLDAYTVGAVLDIHAPAIMAFVEDAGTPARKELLLKVRR